MSVEIESKPRPPAERERLVFSATDAEETAARFGRSRFLKSMGGAIFATAASLAVKATPAYAAACNLSGAPANCFGFDECNCCGQYSCCASGCTVLNGNCPTTPDGHPDGPNYWSSCAGGYLFNCADFCQTCSDCRPGSSCGGGKCACICRFYIGTC